MRDLFAKGCSEARDLQHDHASFNRNIRVRAFYRAKKMTLDINTPRGQESVAEENGFKMELTK